MPSPVFAGWENTPGAPARRSYLQLLSTCIRIHDRGTIWDGEIGELWSRALLHGALIPWLRPDRDRSCLMMTKERWSSE